MTAFFSFSSIGQFIAQCISLQNTHGSNGFLGDDAVASLLGDGLPFLLVLLECFDCEVGLLLTPS
jgi:hypothetical protein